MGKFFILPKATLVRNMEEGRRAVKELSAASIIAVDTETTGLSRPKDFAVIISLSTGNNRYTVWPDAFPAFVELLEDPTKDLLLWNANFDTWMLYNVGIGLYRHMQPGQYRLYDGMIMHALQDVERPHTLKFASLDMFGIEMRPFMDVFGDQLRGKNKRPLHEVLLDPKNEEIVGNYAGLDAFITFRACAQLRKELKTQMTGNSQYPTMWDYFIQTEVPFTRVLYEVEREGFRFNADLVDRFATTFEKKLQEIHRWFAKRTGNPLISLSNKTDMPKLFFEDLGIKPRGYTPAGVPQLDKPFLEVAARKHPEAVKLLEYRDLHKKSSTYTRQLVKLMHRGRLHPTLRQAGARTGRLSAADPSIQNQPSFIREAYIPDEGFLLYARDFSQLEMRILAHLTKDPVLTKAIRDGKDVHSMTAAMMYHVEYDDIIAAKNKDDDNDKLEDAGLPRIPLTDAEKLLLSYRKGSKALGFGLVYGMGVGKLASTLHITTTAAKELMDLYFSTLPSVKDYFAEAIHEAEGKGYTSTILGRQRSLPGLTSALGADYASALRIIKNTPIQGCQPGQERILTRKGMVRLNSAPPRGEVWTGMSWAPYTLLDRGPHQLAHIQLDNGHTINCDTRHSVLVSFPDGYRFVHYADLQPGDKVCLSTAQPLEFGEPMERKDEAYWMGYCIGNAWASSKRNTLSIHIGDRKGRYSRGIKADECQEWFKERIGRESPRTDHTLKALVSITVQDKQLKEDWTALGYPWGCTAEHKTVPDCIWSASLADRRGFLVGLLDADGSVGVEGKTSPNLHMSAYPLLEEVQVLLRTVGVESKLTDFPSDLGYRLDLNGGQAIEHLDYGDRGPHPRTTVRMRAPAHLVRKYLSLVPISPAKSGTSEYTLHNRMKHGGSTSIYQLLRLASLSQAHLGDVYAFSEVVRTYESDAVETTYTLSVDNPGHRFDGGGVIHKNSAADICKMAMVKFHEDTWMHNAGVRMCGQIHDEIIVQGPEAVIRSEEFVERFRDIMEHPLNYELHVPLDTTGKAGKTWLEAK